MSFSYSWALVAPSSLLSSIRRSSLTFLPAMVRPPLSLTCFVYRTYASLMYWPVFASAPESGSTAPILSVSGMFAAAFAVADADGPAPVPVPPPPHAAITNAATSAIAESFRMFILPPACRGTARLCARSRQALRALPPVKHRASRDPPDPGVPAVRTDDPELGPAAEQRAQGAGRPKIDSVEGRRRRAPGQAEEGALLSRDVG